MQTSTLPREAIAAADHHGFKRLPTTTAENPTAASVARWQQRLMESFVPPARRVEKDGTVEADKEYQPRWAKSLADHQQKVRPPALPLIGHGQQLAAIRFEVTLEMEAERLANIPAMPVSRQYKRRATLKHLKAVAAAERKATIANRRRKRAA